MIGILNSLWDSDLSMTKNIRTGILCNCIQKYNKRKRCRVAHAKGVMQARDRDSLSCFDTNVYVLYAHNVIEHKQIQSYTLCGGHSYLLCQNIQTNCITMYFLFLIIPQYHKKEGQFTRI